MKGVYIVLFPLNDYVNVRYLAENIEGMEFRGSVDTAIKIKSEIIKILNTKVDLNGIEVWGLSDFMDLVNDEQFYVDEYFISYVYIVK